MSESIWFWEKDGEQHGPASVAEIKAGLESGEIGADTLVWHEGMTDWKPLRETELREHTAGPPRLPTSSKAPATTGVLTPVAVAAATPIREARIREDFEPHFRSTLGRAWELLKSDFWVFVGMSALMGLLIGVAAQLYVTVFFLIYPLMAGLSWYLLNRIRGLPVTIDALFFGFKRRFSDLALLNLVLITPFIVIFILLIAVVVAIAVAGAASMESTGAMSEKALAITFVGGTLLLTFLATIPYLAILAVANFSMLLILDCDMPWKAAMSLAWKVVRKHLFKFMVMMFLYSLIAQLGLILLYFGAFITGAWASIAMVYLYEDAFGDEAPESADGAG